MRTPLTDAHIKRTNNRFEGEVDADFARTLERELAEANARYKRLRGAVNGMTPIDLERLEQLEKYLAVGQKAERELAEAKWEISELNKALKLKFDAMPSGLSAGQSEVLEQNRDAWRKCAEELVAAVRTTSPCSNSIISKALQHFNQLKEERPVA